MEPPTTRGKRGGREPDTRYVSYDEAEVLLSCRRTTLKRLIRDGEVTVMIVAGHRRIRLKSIEDYLRRQLPE